ncbi:MAG: hypothetical protein K2I45_00070 [Muribaculaceae bacterium]|nr:hypothetical protein [Muribaculaceae bacterium]
MNDSRPTLPAIVPDTHPDHLLPAYDMSLVMEALSPHSSEEIADALAEAVMIVTDAMISGKHPADSERRFYLYILRKLYRAFHKSETDLELLHERLSRQQTTDTGMFSPHIEEVPV